MSKIIIGLDLATHTGWCCLKDGVYVSSGVQDFSKRRGEGNGLMLMRYAKWLQELISLCTDGLDWKWPVQLIAYEQAHMRGGAATEICVGLQTHTQSVCATLGIETAPVHTHTLKKFALGKGRGDKSEMVQKAQSWLHTFHHANMKAMSLESDDEADAIHVARWAFQEYGTLNTQGEHHE
jgi:Holliday junction resolvasome RuvABC endonuclease subunit